MVAKTMKKGSASMSAALSFRGERAETNASPFRNSRQYGIGAVLVGHRCLVFGGYSQNHDRIGTYDVVKRSWTPHFVQNVKRLYGRVRMTFIVDDVLYVYLWRRNSRSCIFLKLDVVSMEELVPAGKSPCQQMGFGTSGSYIESRNEGVLFGGKQGRTDVCVYSIEKASWYRPKTNGAGPSARFNHTTCSQGRNMFVLGGQKVGQHDVIRPFEIHILTMDRRRFTWSTPHAQGYVPPERYLFAAACTAGRVFVFGGYLGDSSFDIFSLEHNSWRKGYYKKNESGRHEGFQFRCPWTHGTSDHAMVLTPLGLLVVGGFQLPIATPLHITPM